MVDNNIDDVLENVSELENRSETPPAPASVLGPSLWIKRSLYAQFTAQFTI
jgi:hypothetical protein